MVKAPTPEEEDRRQSLPRAQIIDQRTVQHVNRIKGCYFGKAYPATSRCAAIDATAQRVRTAMAVLAKDLKTQISRAPIGSNLLRANQGVDWSGTRCLRAKSRAVQGRGHVTGFNGIGPEFTRFSWSEGLFRGTSTSAPGFYAGLRRRLAKWSRRSRAGSFESRQLMCDNTHSTRLVWLRISRNPGGFVV